MAKARGDDGVDVNSYTGASGQHTLDITAKCGQESSKFKAHRCNDKAVAEDARRSKCLPAAREYPSDSRCSPYANDLSTIFW